MKMDRFKCHGWLWVMVEDGDPQMKVWLTHLLPHAAYTDISIPDATAELITTMRDSSAAKVRDLLCDAQQQTYAGGADMELHREAEP
jgi:hypothetical protein